MPELFLVPGEESFRDHVKDTIWDMCKPDNELYEKFADDDELIDRIVGKFDIPFTNTKENIDALVDVIKWATMEK